MLSRIDNRMGPDFEFLVKALPTVFLFGGIYFLASKLGNIYRAVAASAVWGLGMGFLMLTVQQMPLDFTNWRLWFGLAGFAGLGAVGAAGLYLRLENAARERRSLPK
jgi:hypothetical protein